MARTRRVAAAAVALVAAVSACGDQEPAGGALPPPSPAETTAPPTTLPERPLADLGWRMYETGAAPVADFIGRDLATFDAAVEAAGLGPVRIVWEDGEHVDLDADLIVGRVDVAVRSVDGEQIVIDAFVEHDPESGSVFPEATVEHVYEAVQFYPACGNERLRHEGLLWHQVNRGDYPEIYERAANGYREQPPESVSVKGFAPRVVEPGPGDDVGTLVVWSDDVAYFVSDSGDLTVWLVLEELEYGWVC